MFKFKYATRDIEKVKKRLLRRRDESYDRWMEWTSQRMVQFINDIRSEFPGKGVIANNNINIHVQQKGKWAGSIRLVVTHMAVIYIEYGTQAHGPVKAKVLHFFIDGKEIFTPWVRGIQPPRLIITRNVTKLLSDLETMADKMRVRLR